MSPASLRHCKRCNAPFHGFGRKVYCTTRCQEKYQREKPQVVSQTGKFKRECRQCGISFRTSHHSKAFCTSRCTSQWHKENPKKDAPPRNRGKDLVTWCAHPYCDRRRLVVMGRDGGLYNPSQYCRFHDDPRNRETPTARRQRLDPGRLPVAC